MRMKRLQHSVIRAMRRAPPLDAIVGERRVKRRAIDRQRSRETVHPVFRHKIEERRRSDEIERPLQFMRHMTRKIRALE